MIKPSTKLSETFGMNQVEVSLSPRNEAQRTNVRLHSDSRAGQSTKD